MDIPCQGTARTDENSEVEKTLNIFKIIYTNADSLQNKMEELKVLLSNLPSKPSVIVVTEVKPKRQPWPTVSEFSISGYNIFGNKLEEENRDILIYVDKQYNADIVDRDNDFKEYLEVCIRKFDTRADLTY